MTNTDLARHLGDLTDALTSDARGSTIFLLIPRTGRSRDDLRTLHTLRGLDLRPLVTDDPVAPTVRIGTRTGAGNHEDNWLVPLPLDQGGDGCPDDFVAAFRRVLDSLPHLQERGLLALDPWGSLDRYAEGRGLDHDLDLCHVGLVEGPDPVGDFTLTHDLGSGETYRHATPGEECGLYMYVALPLPTTRKE